jgi:hypothetical protein
MAPPDPRADYISLNEAVALTQRSREAIRAAVRAGKLPRRYLAGPNGPRLAFRREELLRWLLPDVGDAAGDVSERAKAALPAPAD